MNWCSTGNDTGRLTSDLLPGSPVGGFVDHVIVPTLVERFLCELRATSPELFTPDAVMTTCST